MNRLSLAGMLMLPIAMAACAPKTAPEPVVVLSPGEQACILRGAEASGADAATVTATPTASTKVGDTIYTVIANGIGYNCVVSPEGAVTSFSAQ